MVPDKVDLQNDFVREDLIREFAEQFADFIEVDQADGGIMHAAWPSDWMSLDRNEVLDEAQEIGGTEAPAGAWIQGWKFHDDDLWSLVADGILEGYSIGGVDVHWDGPFEQDDLPDDVTVPDEIDEDEWVWQIVRGIIREVSAVDIPAVPDAMILETKADAEKRLADHLGNRDGFIEEAQQRGHTESEAERLWDVLNEAVDIEGAGEPGDKSWFERAREFFSPGGLGAAERPTPKSQKEGRTLSTANRESLMASIDAGLDVLHDAGEDDLPKRFTDRDDVDFDLTEHSARTWAGDHDDEDEEESPIDNAAGGDTPESGSTDTATTMSDENDTNADLEDVIERLDDIQASQEEHSKRIDELESDDPDPDASEDEPPEWAKSLQEDVNENSQRLAEALGDGEGDDPFEDAPEWAKSLKDDIDANADRIDTISQQSGRSQQLGASADGDGDGEGEERLGGLGKALS